MPSPDDPAVADVLGDKVISTSLTAKPFPEPSPPPATPSFPLKLALFGVSFSGKTEQAQRLSERYGVRSISVDSELAAAIEFSNKVQLGSIPEPDASDELATSFMLLGREAQSLLVKGGEVSDDIYTSLAFTAIKKLAAEKDTEGGLGWILEDFPQTTKQAIFLEKALSGYDAEAHVHHPYDRKSELAPPGPRIDPPFEVIQSGVDLVFNLKNEVGVTLRRCLGKRLDPMTGEQYHLETARPPYDLVCKERLVEPEDPENASDNLSLHALSHETGVKGIEDIFAKFDNMKVVKTGGLTNDGVFAVISKQIDAFLEKQAEEAKKLAKEKADAKAAEEEKLAAEEEAKRIDEEKAAMKLEDEEQEGESAVPEPEPEGDVEPSAPVVPVLSQELGAVLDARFGAASTRYSALVQRTLRALREERIQLSQHLHDVREAFKEMLLAVDDKQPVLSAFCKEFNAVDTDMRFDDRTKSELLLRVEEMRDALWTLVETRRSEVETRLAETREDGWVEKRTHSLQGDFAFMMQLEVDRFFHGVELLQDNVSAMTGTVPLEATEGVLTGIGDDAEAVEEDKKGGKKGKKDDKKKGKKGDKGGDEEPEQVKPAERSKVPPTVFAPLPFLLKTKAEEEEPVVEDKKAKKGKKGAAVEEDVVEKDMLLGTLEKAVAYATSHGAEALKLAPLEKLEEGQSHPEGLLADREKVAAMLTAVNYEADLLKARVQRLYDAGLTATQKVQGLALKCYDEVQESIDVRIKGELEAVEKLVVAAVDKVKAEESIEYFWGLQSLEFKILTGKRILPVPVPPEPPAIVQYGYSSFNPGQLAVVEEGLMALEGDSDGAAVEDVTAYLYSLACEEGGVLPDLWAGKDYNDFYDLVLGLAGLGDIVIKADVVEFFKDTEEVEREVEKVEIVVVEEEEEEVVMEKEENVAMEEEGGEEKKE